MKNLISLLLLSVIFLTGCSKDEPQKVTFSMHEHTVPHYGEVCSVNVSANCPWTISENSREVVIQELTGTGHSFVRINIASNLGYDDLEHNIIITSEDGTSTDKLVIHQQTKKAILIDSKELETVAAEGEEFTVPVSTNDEISKLETPDWITLKSSRALDKYTYTFAAESNKTSSLRKGTVRFTCKEVTDSIEIEQDSYAPTGVQLDRIGVLNTSLIHAKIKLVPEYADWSKLETVPSDGCKTIVSNGWISVNVADYGEYNIKFYCDNKLLHNEAFWFLPKDPVSTEKNQSLVLGQEMNIKLSCEHPDMVMTSSDPSVIKVTDDWTVKAVGLGEAIVSVEIPNTNVKGEIHFKTLEYSTKAQIARLNAQSYYIYFQLIAQITTYKKVKIKSYKIVDRNGLTILTNGGYVCYPSANNACVLSEMFPVRNFGNGVEHVSGFKFYIKAEIDGKEKEFVQTINHIKIGMLGSSGAIWINHHTDNNY